MRPHPSSFGEQRPRSTTKRLLLLLSHAMEQGFDTPPLPGAAVPAGLVLGLFQRREYFDREADRYAALARRGCTVIVGFAGSVDGIPDGVRAVSFDPRDPLAREWVVILLRGAFGNALVAHDDEELGDGESTLQDSRLFSARWTFDRAEVIDQARGVVALLAPALPPAVLAAASASIRASAAEPVSEVETQLSAAADHLVAFLELGTRRNRRERAGRDGQRALAERDHLTGLHNRQFLQRFLGFHVDDPVDLAVLLVGIDDLAGVNDRFGHQAGDEVVRTVARSLLADQRPGDVVVRWGGDEFLVLAAGLGADEGLALAERLAAGVRRVLADRPGYGAVSASIGVGLTTRTVLPIDALGAALSQVKRTRRGHAGFATAASAA